jgi:hypothetical protein
VYLAPKAEPARLSLGKHVDLCQKCITSAGLK